LENWNSEEGEKRLLRARFKTDFFQLANHYQPQIDPLSCGIATSVIVLNALRRPLDKVESQKGLEVLLPKALGGKVIAYPLYSQVTFLNEKTEKVKPKAVIRLKNVDQEGPVNPKEVDPGLTLAQLKKVLEAYGASVSLRYADREVPAGSVVFRKHLKKVLKDKDHFLIVNFEGKALGAETAGHISPIAAYDDESDSALILDTAGHKNPWVWVQVDHLYQAMKTKDGDKYRGYLIVSD